MPAIGLSVRDFGAAGDGKTLDTAAIQSAIDACSAASGGMLYFPAGDYLTGTLCMKDGVTLHLEAGARLLGSTDLAHYPEFNGQYALIYAREAQGIGFCGEGCIDGQGIHFPCGTEGFNGEDEDKAPLGEARVRPMLMVFENCRRLNFQRLQLLNAACYTAYFLHCADIHIDGVRLHSRQNQNTDGFHFFACQNALIANCDINCGDDAFPLNESASNFVITNCVITTRWAAFRMGPGARGVFKDIAISNCVIHDTYGAAIKLQMVEGGCMENLLFDNLVMDNVTGPISIRLAGYLGWKLERKESLPIGQFRNVRFSNIRATVPENSYPLPHEVQRMAGELRSCINITGLPGHPVEGVTFSDVHVTFAGGGTAEEAARRDVPEMRDYYPEYHMFGTLPAYGLYARHASGLVLENVTFDLAAADLRPAAVFEDVSELELSNFRAAGSPESELLRLRGVRGAYLHGCRALSPTRAFMRLEGGENRAILLQANDLRRAAQPAELAEGATLGALAS